MIIIKITISLLYFLDDNSAALPEESASNSQDLFDTPPSQPLSQSGSESILQPLPLISLLPAVNIQVPRPVAAVVELGTLTAQKAENPKKRKATADDVYGLQVKFPICIYFRNNPK